MRNERQDGCHAMHRHAGGVTPHPTTISTS